MAGGTCRSAEVMFSASRIRCSRCCREVINAFPWTGVITRGKRCRASILSAEGLLAMARRMRSRILVSNIFVAFGTLSIPLCFLVSRDAGRLGLVRGIDWIIAVEDDDDDEEDDDEEEDDDDDDDDDEELAIVGAFSALVPLHFFS
jgi:hypothetical protein